MTAAEQPKPTTRDSEFLRDIGQQQHFIDGDFRPSVSGKTFATHDPISNDVIAQASAGETRDIEAAVAAARRAFDQGPWSETTAADRAIVLRKIADLIRRDAQEFIALECLDIGMPISQMKGLAARAAENFDYFAKIIEELAGKAWQTGNFLNYSVHKPVGVAGLIMPWNAPLMLSTWRIAPCLAAGNTIVLKPAEWSPLTATRLAKLMSEAGLPDGVFNVVHGFGEEAGAPLSAHEGVDLICFTGETKTGETIMAAGAPTLKRSSFELGGKSPVVVFDDADADFDRLVDAVVFQIFSMNGQRCTAGARLLVQEGLYSRLVDAVAERARALTVGDPFDPSTELGPLIGPEHHSRVSEFIEEARADGGRIVAGGSRPDALPDGNFLEPTVIADVTPEMRVFREEIFGPVLVAMSFSDEAEAIELANATKYGLAAYVWTQDIKRGHRVAQAIDVGLCWINSQNVRDLRTPFGGVKGSGIGREGGEYSFEFYCEQEAIHVSLGEHRIPRLGVPD